MSRIGNLAIPIPGGVDVDVNPGIIHVKGPKGELSQSVDLGMTFTRDEGTLRVSRPSDERKYRSLHGLTRTLVANMVQGVTQGYRISRFRESAIAPRLMVRRLCCSSATRIQCVSYRHRGSPLPLIHPRAWA